MNHALTEEYDKSVVLHLILGERTPSRLRKLYSAEAGGLFPETITVPYSTDPFHRIV